ncbi:ABC transporter ATP-binding protein [Thermodesulfobacteriota bacterium]
MMLRVENITCRYGSAIVLTDITLEVDRGEIVCLLGSNGAGKSTLVKAICGALRPASGRIIFEDKEIQGKSPNKVMGTGIAVVPENRRVFPQLSVTDNLVVGAYVHRRDGKSVIKEKMNKVFETFPALKGKARDPVGMLSGGQQQMLAIGMGLMAEPKLLILDEPSLGLAPVIIPFSFRSMVRLNQRQPRHHPPHFRYHSEP